MREQTRGKGIQGAGWKKDAPRIPAQMQRTDAGRKVDLVIGRDGTCQRITANFSSVK